MSAHSGKAKAASIAVILAGTTGSALGCAHLGFGPVWTTVIILAGIVASALVSVAEAFAPRVDKINRKTLERVITDAVIRGKIDMETAERLLRAIEPGRGN